ncbi:T9SS type A sorting domain-containing protein [Cryomorpha ignava]|uniref:T9SS type A sorting domain-containing protein n=1 Tax=Cryomorpha ignava TaxID=101383 RepID=A0A7K3WNN2_9FLAO|nr:choice-of-anchor J domain-containing protein [Cryomorpha ignava]NEN23263.1 T9SS type A sorting domain-containing protein [Cryomorpha ignava]
MIKNLLFSTGIVAALTCFSAVDSNAQMTEGFEDGFLPPCWTQIDADGDGQGWFQYNAAGSAYEGAMSAASASWNQAILTPDNYLVTPQLTIGAGELLSYYVSAQDPAYPDENYSVLVSTSGNEEADFTDELLVELTDSVWTLRTIDMSAYEGQDIYIAFRHYDVTDNFYMKLDNVTLPGVFTNVCVVDPVLPVVLLEGAESFEADTVNFPDCWQTIDADGDGNSWNLLPAANLAFDGVVAARSESYINPPGAGAITPDNYLITPLLDIVDGDSLYYVVRAISANFPAENYSVLVSTTGTEISDFSDEVLTEVLESAAYEGRSVDLSGYAGESIYIAFRHHDVTDQFAFLIDAIYLPGVNCIPDAVTELEKVESNLFPNPATNNLNITSSLEGAATVRVFDAIGRIVLENNVNLSQATFTQNISSLENGIYTIQISTTDKVATQRFVKQ